MELSTIFGTDNPFKFFFLAGIILFGFGINYPIEKSHEIDFLRAKALKEGEILKSRVSDLNEQIYDLNESSKLINKKIDSLTLLGENSDPEKSNEINQQIAYLKKDFNDKYDSLFHTKIDLDKCKIDFEYLKKEIAIHTDHLDQIKTYTWVMIIVGLALAVVGALVWILHYLEDRKAKKIES